MRYFRPFERGGGFSSIVLITSSSQGFITAGLLAALVSRTLWTDRTPKSQDVHIAGAMGFGKGDCCANIEKEGGEMKARDVMIRISDYLGPEATVEEAVNALISAKRGEKGVGVKGLPVVKSGNRISFGRFLLHGMPIMIMTVVISTVYVWVRYYLLG